MHHRRWQGLEGREKEGEKEEEEEGVGRSRRRRTTTTRTRRRKRKRRRRRRRRNLAHYYDLVTCICDPKPRQILGRGFSVQRCGGADGPRRSVNGEVGGVAAPEENDAVGQSSVDSFVSICRCHLMESTVPRCVGYCSLRALNSLCFSISACSC